MTYSPTKFEVATSYGLGDDTFTRNVTDGRKHVGTDRRRTDYDTKLIYGYNKVLINIFKSTVAMQVNRLICSHFNGVILLLSNNGMV